MRKQFVALYDVIGIILISIIMLPIALYLLFLPLEAIKDEYEWIVGVIYGVCLMTPILSITMIQRITIDLHCDKMDIFFLVNTLANRRDSQSNWIIYPSEIERIDVVRLTKTEKRKYTSAKFLFSKYLKIEMKYGHTKYVYVSHYSNSQIQSIIKMLNTARKHKII